MVSKMTFCFWVSTSVLGKEDACGDDMQEWSVGCRWASKGKREKERAGDYACLLERRSRLTESGKRTGHDRARRNQEERPMDKFKGKNPWVRPIVSPRGQSRAGAGFWGRARVGLAKVPSHLRLERYIRPGTSQNVSAFVSVARTRLPVLVLDSCRPVLS
jgi:hypothetical protein